MTVQSASLPGRVEFSSADLRVRSRALRAAARAREASIALHDHPPRVGRVLLEVLAEFAVDDLLDQAADRRVAEFGLGLALELGVVQLDRDHRGQPLAHVLAGEVVVFLFQQPFVARVGVQGPGQRRAEAGEVGAALVGVDVVGEAEDRLLVGGVPLHRDLDLALLFAALEVDDLVVHLVLVLVEVADEVLDAALVLEGDAVGLAALVDQLDLQAAGEEGGLAQPLGQGLEVELDLFEDLEVGQEGDAGAVLVGRLALGQVGHRFAALVVLGPDVAVAADLQVQALGERVDDRDADAVQAAGDLVAAAVAELAAGVEDGQHDLGRGPLLFRHRLDRDAAAVVLDRAAVVRMQDDADAVAVAGQGLVDRVVDDLVDEVMEAARAGRADVHAGTLADRFQSLEDGDVLGAVGGVGLRDAGFFLRQ